MSIAKNLLWLFIQTQLFWSGPAIAHSHHPQCSTEIQPLIKQLLQDLPSYANRIMQRSRLPGINQTPGSVLLAGNPEFEPLPLTTTQTSPTTDHSPEPRQVFITTLEREYVSGKAIEIQQFHWLFLTETPHGWQLVIMFSRTGSYPNRTPPSPPRESSNSAIGQAIRAWLLDCSEKN